MWVMTIYGGLGGGAAPYTVCRRNDFKHSIGVLEGRTEMGTVAAGRFLNRNDTQNLFS